MNNKTYYGKTCGTCKHFKIWNGLGAPYGRCQIAVAHYPETKDYTPYARAQDDDACVHYDAIELCPRCKNGMIDGNDIYCLRTGHYRCYVWRSDCKYFEAGPNRADGDYPEDY